LAAPQTHTPLPEILRSHAAWLGNPRDGFRADLSALTLNDADLHDVALARAFVVRPALLLADEPSGALDSLNSEAVMRLMHDACKRRGMAAVVVTHDAQLASWADRVVFLRDGRAIDQTAPVPDSASLIAPGQTQ